MHVKPIEREWPICGSHQSDMACVLFIKSKFTYFCYEFKFFW